MRTFKEISQKIGKAEPIDFKTLFEDSVEVFKKVWLQGMILQIISMCLSGPLLLFNYSLLDFSNFSINSAPDATKSVSYTHLTLPTILLV